LAPQTAFAILYLGDRATQVAITEGSANIRIPMMDEGEKFEIDTPNAAVTMQHTGSYRIDVHPDHDYILVTVRSGDAEVAAGGQIFPVKAGQMLRLFGVEQVTAEFLPAPEPDPWDEFCMSCDELAERSLAVSEPYVAPDMVGAEDLAD